MHFDVLELVELSLPVAGDAAPFRHARIAHDIADMPADFGFRLADMDIVAPLAQNASGLGPGGPRADHENRSGVLDLIEFLRVPAAAVFLVGDGVLRANERSAALPS